jgi:membrane-associated phospholipid phosphatase
VSSQPADLPRSLGVATGCATALLVIYGIAVWTVAGQVADTRAMLIVAEALEGAQWTATILWLVSPVSVLLAALAVVSTAVLLRQPRSAVAAGLTVVGTVLGAEVLKVVLTRPSWLDDAGNSLPSGHVAAAAGLTAGAILSVPAALRPVVGMMGAGVVAATGLATMAQGWHRPSDVAASIFLAIAVAASTYVAIQAPPVRGDQPMALHT